MPKKKIVKESELAKPYHKKKAQNYLEQEELSGLYVSQMNGDDFEVDKDVEKSKRIDPNKVFQNYNSTKREQDKKKNKKKINKIEPKMDDKNKKNSYKL
jgi:hypothetical protein